MTSKQRDRKIRELLKEVAALILFKSPPKIKDVVLLTSIQVYMKER